MLQSNEPVQISERTKSGRQPNNERHQYQLSQRQTPPTPLPATSNFLNSETRSVRQVCNNSRLALNARLDADPAPSAYLLNLQHLPGALGSTVSSPIMELTMMNLLLMVLGRKKALGEPCVGSIGEEE